MDLLSGFIGAIIASFLTIVYLYFAAQISRRGDILMEIVAWGDELYDRIGSLHNYKAAVYTGGKVGLTESEYSIISREVKTMLLFMRVQTIVVLAFGEGEELRSINALKGELLKVSEILWAAEKATWKKSEKEILDSFKIIDPLRGSVQKMFLRKTRINTIVLDIIECHIPSVFKIICLIKRSSNPS